MSANQELKPFWKCLDESNMNYWTQEEVDNFKFSAADNKKDSVIEPF